MTLTEVSFYSRKFAPFGLLALLILLIFYYLIRVLLLTVTPAPQVMLFTDPIFGKIKKPIIANTKPSSGFNYTLDTIEGKPVTATESAKVHFLPSSTTKFGYRERIYLIAKSIGFDTEVVKHKLEGKEAIFEDVNQTLKIDITNLNFTYEYNLENNPQIFQNSIVPQERDSQNKAAEFLKLVGRYPDELIQGKSNTIFIAYSPEAKQMRLLQSNVGANMAEVDFYRPDQEIFPVVSPKYFNSQNYVMLTLYESEYKVIKAQIKFYEKSDSQVGIYPVKSGDLAWEELKNGKGLIIQNESTGKDILIKKMFLGYYDPDVYQEYLQPVYVFLGDNNFVGYVPAITDEYFSE